MIEYITSSAEELIELGVQVGKTLPPNAIVCFFGDLAAGKTTFIKGLVSGAADYPIDDVNSPTFTYLNIYSGKITVYHFDLYRLQDQDEFFAMGFQEYFDAEGICCIEWSERIESELPRRAIKIHLEHWDNLSRKIKISQSADS